MAADVGRREDLVAAVGAQMFQLLAHDTTSPLISPRSRGSMMVRTHVPV